MPLRFIVCFPQCVCVRTCERAIHLRAFWWRLTSVRFASLHLRSLVSAWRKCPAGEMKWERTNARRGWWTMRASVFVCVVVRAKVMVGVRVNEEENKLSNPCLSSLYLPVTYSHTNLRTKLCEKQEIQYLLYTALEKMRLFTVTK